MLPHEEWLFKAEHDVKSAELLARAVEPLLDIAIYHTQQCAEKSLKAYLAFRTQPLERTHNLMLLAAQCRGFDASFASLSDDVLFLNPYGTLCRYPEGDLVPQADEVKDAIECAWRIYRFVREAILR